MLIRTDLPRPIRTVDHEWITLSDGCRQAARIWLPEDADQHPVPAILEYTPYRKNDWTSVNDRQTHAYFAGHGYASLRVDLRGSGDSDGLLRDEYLLQEQEDALEVLDWIARQPWCTGSIGMIGYSWGGFNALQVAARRPPALKAIVSHCSTDDRYADDVHYMGGCILGEWMLRWATMFLNWNGRPPDPSIVGDVWREMWLERLEQSHPVIDTWLSHQRRDDYWKHGSVCEEYAAIECPVYMIGGWADGYHNAVFRFLEHFTGEMKALVGPWGHTWPHIGLPGPPIGFLQECLRWWDQWLKKIDTGIMDEPQLTIWMQDAVRPQPQYAVRPGRWIREPSWPPTSGISARTWVLNVETLDDSPAPIAELTVCGNESVGLDGGDWLPFGRPADLPQNQRVEDSLSLSFTSEPLADPIEILGFPVVGLRLTSDQPSALVAVRLCDVSPNGESTLVTRGLLNLTHREGHDHPSALTPGRPYEVTVDLSSIAYSFPVGNRIRVSISPTYWPFAWPSPRPVSLSVHAGASTLTLPSRSSRPEDAETPDFGRPESAAPLPAETLAVQPQRRSIRRDLGSGLIEVNSSWTYFGTRRLLDNGHETGADYQERCAIVEGDPLSATAEYAYVSTNARGEWKTRVETTSTLTSTEETFDVTASLDAFEGERRVFARRWTFAIPRDHV